MDKQRCEVHRYRVQSEEKLPRRPVWHSIYSASLGPEGLRHSGLIQAATFDVHWESISRRDLKLDGEVELMTQSKDHTAIVNKGLPDLHTCQT